MRFPEDLTLKIVPCPLTIREVHAFLDASVEQWGSQGLRIDIRGMFRGGRAKERIQLLDWHFLKCWSACFQVMGVLPLSFDEGHQPWPEVRYLLYEGPAELRFRLRRVAEPGEQERWRPVFDIPDPGQGSSAF